jgi:cephalosporin-C deacetylase
MPAVFDLPIQELKKYTGRTPRPDDFDQYWDSALRELDSVPPRIEINSADFECDYAKCFDLWFDGVRGARIYSKLAIPRTRKNPVPALLSFHGYSTASEEWLSLLSFAAEGFVVAAMDCRGQGGKTNDPGGVPGYTLRGHILRGIDGSSDQLHFRQIFLDTVQLARVVGALEEVDEDHIATYGGSQGGALSLACAALHPTIKMTAPTYPFLCDYQRVWEMGLAKDAYQDITEYFYRFDRKHERETEIFRKLGYIDIQNFSNRITAEVLWGIGMNDTICPPSTQFAAYNKLRSRKRMIIYPDFGHEYIPGHSEEIFQFVRKMKENQQLQ